MIHKRILSLLMIVHKKILVIIYVFDIHHRRYFSTPQPIKVIFDLRPVFPAATNLIGYSLLLTHKIISISADGGRQFDFISV